MFPIFYSTEACKVVLIGRITQVTILFVINHCSPLHNLLDIASCLNTIIIYRHYLYKDIIL